MTARIPTIKKQKRRQETTGPKIKNHVNSSLAIRSRASRLVTRGLWDMELIDNLFTVDLVKQPIQPVYDFKLGEAANAMPK